MSVPLRLRLLEWFADASPRTQFPRPARDAEFHWFRWENPMPLWRRISYALLFLWLTVVSLTLLAVLLFLAGAFIHAIF